MDGLAGAGPRGAFPTSLLPARSRTTQSMQFTHLTHIYTAPLTHALTHALTQSLTHSLAAFNLLTPLTHAQVRPHAGFPGLSGPTEGRTYMWYTGTPLFPFGWGLSYTSFALTWSGGAPKPVSVPLTNGAAGLTDVEFAVEVTNTGKVAGKEIVMVFWAPPNDVDPLLHRQLFDFQVCMRRASASAGLGQAHRLCCIQRALACVAMRPGQQGKATVRCWPQTTAHWP